LFCFLFFSFFTLDEGRDNWSTGGKPPGRFFLKPWGNCFFYFFFFFFLTPISAAFSQFPSRCSAPLHSLPGDVFGPHPGRCHQENREDITRRNFGRFSRGPPGRGNWIGRWDGVGFSLTSIRSSASLLGHLARGPRFVFFVFVNLFLMKNRPCRFAEKRESAGSRSLAAITRQKMTKRAFERTSIIP